MQENINIIHVITNPVGGGAEFIARSINEGLSEYNIKSCIIYLWNPKNYNLRENEYCLNLKSPNDLSIFLKIRNKIKELSSGCEENTIIHSHLTQALYYIPIATAGMGIRRVFTEHSTHNWRRDVRWLKLLERIIYRKYDRIICISPGVLKALAIWLGRSECRGLVLVKNGAHQFGGGKREVPSQLNIVSVGSLNTHKGFDISIKAVLNVESIVNRYIIVGEGPERQVIEELIMQKNANNLISLVGWSDDISDALQDADLMIIPSRWEGFGLVAIEGLSAGLPVICSDVDGLRDVVEGCEAAFLFPTEDVEALAETIRRVGDSMMGGKSFSEAAKAHAAKYSVQNMVSEYRRVYAGVLTERGQSVGGFSA